ncbi:putative secreted protein [Corynebacterium pilosum]|uniref:Putative secreted protein n=2 Tax=Corynebacterium pilosum TaxID=35756 RepID=A0A376CNP1_9CORY|nr:putative secreted protein [Corynebacterium pilosum]
MRMTTTKLRTAVASATAGVMAVGALAAPAATANSELSSAWNHWTQKSSEFASTYIDELGRPTDYTVARINEFASQPWVPADVENALRAGAAFFAGGDEIGGPPLPEDAPPFTQFYWPTVSSNCMGPGMHSTASAIAVPGPTPDVKPQPGPGETTFIFTALGTPAAAPEQGLMNVYWFNTTTLQAGVTPLDNNGINKTGPTTLSGVAPTGHGTVIAAVNGAAKTETNTCSFAPTAAVFKA